MEISVGAAAAAEETRLLLEAKATLGPDESGAAGAEEVEARAMRTRAPAASAPRRTCGWLPLPFSPLNKDTEHIPVCKIRDTKHLKGLREKRRRATEPGHFKRLAIDRELVTECLQHYNYMHPDAEYEPAPGKVIAYVSPDFTGVVTCTPLDEPVTEGYSILGFPIWWGTRRNGSSDVICKTCYCHFEFPDRLTSETLSCGHKNAETLCEMCDCRSCVLHPFPDQENVRMPIADTFIATSAEHRGPVWIECIPDF
ncbi:unnamed protein product [Urochloa decumbens]|uniref:Uncharacterized protein n=1 Tax=Urochloa decumbens TaxID=240449 RepID=A0ABC9EPK3_9POAL